MRPSCLALVALALLSACKRDEPSTGPSPTTSTSAIGAVTSSAAPASSGAPALDDVDLAALEKTYCQKPEFDACRLAKEFAAASPFSDTSTNEDIYFGWGYELVRKNDGHKSMVVLRMHTSGSDRMAKGGIYVPADAAATKTTSALVDTLREGGKASGDAKGFFLFLRTNPGPDPFRLLSKSKGTSTVFVGANHFKTWLRRDEAAKGKRVLALSYAEGDVLDGPYPCELRVSEVWEVHTEK